MTTLSSPTPAPVQADPLPSPASQKQNPHPRFPRAAVAGLMVILGVIGLTTIRTTCIDLYGMWTTDALKSIGAIVPFVSLVLLLRVWRRLNWELEGSWWGLAVLLITLAAVQVRDQAILVLVLTPQWNIYLPPHSLVLFAYFSGCVLLAGGTRLYRASLFPILLIFLVNPVPHFFNRFVDLPLQRASAHVARGFAIALGQKLSPDQLRLMFTPDFGMFIAPGCNGIRGAITMGFIALVAGYLYRFRWRAHAWIVLGAIALGYVFNFVRLCTLVLYYIVAVHFPSLQNYGENADYVIGAALFLVATFLLFYVIQRLGNDRLTLPPDDATEGMAA